MKKTKWINQETAQPYDGFCCDDEILTVPNQDMPIREFVEKYTRTPSGVMRGVQGTFSDLPEIEKMEKQDRIVYQKYLKEEVEVAIAQLKEVQEEAAEIKSRKKQVEGRLKEFEKLESETQVNPDQGNSSTDNSGQ